MRKRTMVVLAVLSCAVAACGGSIVSDYPSAPTSTSTTSTTSSTRTFPAATVTSLADEPTATTTIPAELPSSTTSLPLDATADPPVDTASAPTKGTDEAVQLAIADLAGRLEIDASSIHLVSIEARTFNDSSLDCPEAGNVYLQVLTEGYQILLEFGGFPYDYRVDASGFLKLCRS